MRKKLPYGKQYIDKKDISVISKALKKSLVTTGPMVNFLKIRLKILLNLILLLYVIVVPQLFS